MLKCLGCGTWMFDCDIMEPRFDREGLLVGRILRCPKCFRIREEDLQ
jgi:hypothetical protein